MEKESQKRLNELIPIINEHVNSFYKVGKSLKEILDDRLYREHSDRFEDFCKDVLNISRSYAYRKIAAAQVLDNLQLPNGDIQSNEAQLRHLVSLSANDQILAWRYANDIAAGENRKLTASDIRMAVQIVLGKNSSIDKIKKSENKLANIDAVSSKLKKAYENFFKAIKDDMNNNWETTSKKLVLSYLKALIKYLNTHDK